MPRTVFHRLRALLAAGVVASALLASPAAAAPGTATPQEEFRYSWRLRGALAWIAGLKFPVSGTGALRNAPTGSGDRFMSELVITGDKRDAGLYVYRSEIDDAAVKTLMTYNGYQFEGRDRKEQTRFDYGQGVAQIRKEREGREPKTKTQALPAREMRDVLTGIHFLRKKAGTFAQPLRSEIYSDGSLYPVVFRPLGAQKLQHGGKTVAVDVFEIAAAPGDQKKWPGGVRVWLTADSARVPLRIEIRRSMASLQLDLQSAL